jgi:inosine-uridine nucleoside N-ribohydrolase
VPVPILLDCDPGHDDALAIFVAARRSQLVAVTAVSGNAPLKSTLRNALLTLQIAELEVPVHAGAERPLVREPRHAAFIHGESGLDGPTLPPLRREPSPTPAVRAILDAAEHRDDLWLVATGPLTNVALALRQEPGLAQRLRGISLMGGSFGPGNVTAAAEFNVWADPEAAAIVFDSGAHVIMAGLDLTHQFRIDEPRIARIRELGSAPATFSADLLTFYGRAYQRVFGGAIDGPLHDPCAVLAVTDPDMFAWEERHVAIELAGTHTRGMTVVDRRGGERGEAANARVLTSIDDTAAFEAVIDALTVA